MSYFQNLQDQPADSILELMWEFKKDSRPHKIDLSVGIYYDEQLKAGILPSIKEAEKRLLDLEMSKSYLPIDGDSVFVSETKKLLFGEELFKKEGSRIYGTQSVGGTGALRVGAEFLSASIKSSVYVSNPTWDNHLKIFSAAGLEVAKYPYYDFVKNRVDFEKMKEFLETLAPKSILVLHGCCHNPTGADLTKAQWKELSSLMLRKQLIPFFDVAYLGFGEGLEEDSYPVRLFTEEGHECLIAFSYAKICGMYAERVGALFLVAKSATQSQIAATHIKPVIRANYSNPPKHGAASVALMLSDITLKKKWLLEVETMRRRLCEMREVFAKELIKMGSAKDYQYLLSKNGMFCFTGLTEDQVNLLKEKDAIYMMKTGRINVTGLTSHNMPRVIEALRPLIKG